MVEALLSAAPLGRGPFHLGPELEAAIEARAEADHTTTSEIIREALRKFLEVA